MKEANLGLSYFKGDNKSAGQGGLSFCDLTHSSSYVRIQTQIYNKYPCNPLYVFCHRRFSIVCF